MLKAVIIDDEQSARESLTEIIIKYCSENVHLIGTADGVEKGIELIESTKPDLVFLDVELSPGSGFELLDSLDNINFEVIFTTAYNQYALSAIKFSALDYLLKPIDIEELKQAISKANAKNSNNRVEVLKENLKLKDPKLNKVILPTNTGYFVEQLEDIVRCEADSNYTDFYFLNGKKITVCRTLKDYEELFEGLGFFRVHQSHLINISHIKNYIKGDTPQLIMSDGKNVTISRNKKAEFLDVFFKKMIN